MRFYANEGSARFEYPANVRQQYLDIWLGARFDGDEIEQQSVTHENHIGGLPSYCVKRAGRADIHAREARPRSRIGTGNAKILIAWIDSEDLSPKTRGEICVGTRAASEINHAQTWTKVLSKVLLKKCRLDCSVQSVMPD